MDEINEALKKIAELNYIISGEDELFHCLYECFGLLVDKSELPTIYMKYRTFHFLYHP